MKSRLLFPAAPVMLTLGAGPLQSQELTVQIESGKQVVLSRADLEALPHTKITTGTSYSPATFEGVALKAVLERAGVAFGESLKEAAESVLVGGGCKARRGANA
jgi:hypothetical protein